MKKKLLVLMAAVCAFGYTNQAKAQTGAALNLDGHATYVDFGTNPLLGLQTANFSMEAWVNPTGGSGAQLILFNGACNVFDGAWGLSYNGGDFTGAGTANPGKLSFYVFSSVDNNYYQLDQLSNLPTGQWTHVAVTNDGTALKMYINGVLDNTLMGNYIPLNTHSSFKIGADPNVQCDQVPRYVYNGSIDELRLFNYALSPCQIQATMNCELSQSRAGLIFYAKFNEGTAAGTNTITTVADSSGNGFNGTMGNFALNGTTSNWIAPGAVTSGQACGSTIGNVSINATSQIFTAGTSATLTAVGATSYTWTNTGVTTHSIVVSPTVTTTYSLAGTDGICTNMATITLTVALNGAALNFDGSDDFVDAGNSISNTLKNTNLITVEAWVNPSNTNYLGVIAGNYSTQQDPGMQFLLRRDNNNYVFWVDNGSGSFQNVTSVATTTLNTWQHVAGTWDGNMLSIYINGVLDNQVNITGAFKPESNNVWIGGDDINESFTGSIDEVRIWNRALCQAEIQNNMNGELSSFRQGLLVYYKFNQGFDSQDNTTISTVADSSGNGLDGILNNFDLTTNTSNFVAPGAVTTGSMVPAFISTVATQTNVACHGGATGTASVAVSGAAAPFTYTWSSGSGTGSAQGSLLAGTYTCTIDYACGTTAQTFTITEPTKLVASSTSGTIACNGGATTVTVSATGGTPTYSNTGTFSVTANTYTYTVTDANACSATTTITVTEPTQLMASSTSGTIACNGGATTVTVSATGGTPTYSNTGTFSVTANTYTYIVTDANACTATTVISVTQPNPVNASVSNLGGTITANNASATYQWVDCNNSNAPIAGATNQSFTPVSSGSYAVEVTMGSCTATSTCTPITTSGIAKNNATSNLQVYPNPFTNELTVVSSAKTNAILFDMLGNQIRSFALQSTTQTINVSDLAPGMYYLQVDAQKIKIIKQ